MVYPSQSNALLLCPLHFPTSTGYTRTFLSIWLRPTELFQFRLSISVFRAEDDPLPFDSLAALSLVSG